METTRHNSWSISNVLHEREQQDQKWGEQNHNPKIWLAILMEEVSEVAKALIENEPRNYRNELVQVAAVAISAIESFDRNSERDVDVKDEKWLKP